jgi:hypothetical protein
LDLEEVDNVVGGAFRADEAHDPFGRSDIVIVILCDFGINSDEKKRKISRLTVSPLLPYGPSLLMISLVSPKIVR